MLHPIENQRYTPTHNWVCRKQSLKSKDAFCGELAVVDFSWHFPL